MAGGSAGVLLGKLSRLAWPPAAREEAVLLVLLTPP